MRKSTNTKITKESVERLRATHAYHLKSSPQIASFFFFFAKTKLTIVRRTRTRVIVRVIGAPLVPITGRETQTTRARSRKESFLSESINSYRDIVRKDGAPVLVEIP